MVMQKLENLRAVIYNRKSTVSDGKSTRDQERENRNWCATNNIPVEKVITDEGISASRYGKKRRTGYEELKDYLHRGHILVAWEASRATRDIAEGIDLINVCGELGVPMAYSGRVLDLNSGEDRFVGGLDFLLAARESDKIKERVERGIRGAVAAGTPHARPPWGYRSAARKPGTAAQWELDPIEAPRVRDAAARVLNGESRKSVWQSLKSTGYAPATPSAFGRLIANPQIAGKRIHRKEIVGDGTWEPIITWQQHQQLATARIAGTDTPGPESSHLCTGIAKCAKCGRGLRYKSPRTRGNVRQKRGPRYACPQGCASIKYEELDAGVQRVILLRLKNINPDDYNSDNPEVIEALRRIADLDEDLARWKAKAIAEEVGADMYAAVEKDRRAKIAALRPRTFSHRPELLRPENWGAATMREKRINVRALVNITLHPGSIAKITPI